MMEKVKWMEDTVCETLRQLQFVFRVYSNYFGEKKMVRFEIVDR